MDCPHGLPDGVDSDGVPCIACEDMALRVAFAFDVPVLLGKLSQSLSSMGDLAETGGHEYLTAIIRAAADAGEVAAGLMLLASKVAGELAE